jgi:hypothetical protein
VKLKASIFEVFAYAERKTISGTILFILDILARCENLSALTD